MRLFSFLFAALLALSAQAQLMPPSPPVAAQIRETLDYAPVVVQR